MRDYFVKVTRHAKSLLEGEEVLLCNFASEAGDFVRFNNGLIRQPGRVLRHELSLDLILGRRHAGASIPLLGQWDRDAGSVASTLRTLRERRAVFPEDPHLLYSEEVKSTEQSAGNQLPAVSEVVEQIVGESAERDLVGILAMGGVYRGFANSLGQVNWFERYSFDFNWSLYHSGDKAVKSTYSGSEWSGSEFVSRNRSATERLELLARPCKTVPPGEYRVFLSPRALADFAGYTCAGVGLEARRTRRSPLIRMIDGQASMAPAVSFSENTGEGFAPNFQSQGYICPGRIPLIKKGEIAEPLVSPRSSAEYGVPTNGAGSDERPESLDMAAGDIEQENILNQLGTGIFISNLWYLNYSDINWCRLTGMTRFATMWVENGRLQAPLNVMRFDETPYRVLGSNLEGLTRRRESFLSSKTYGWRSTASCRMPGALVRDFRMTL